MFDRILIANRGEISRRITRTAHRLGVRTVAVYSEADAASLHVREADEAVCVGPAAPAESYLNVDAILSAAKDTGAQAVHPGYGFLAENAAFARRCAEAGLVFIGPTPGQLELFGDKVTARGAATAAGVPLAAGTAALPTVEDALNAAVGVGFPVIVKAAAGGGGIGMRVAEDAAALADVFATVKRLALDNFGDDAVYLERYVRRARHVEVQVFGDGEGRVVSLSDRDCSLQRRHQKVIEEAPAPGLPEAVREQMHAAARALAASAAYQSAGTVEFIYDTEREEASFLEFNTRLQVEHPVTEQILGIDLVEWMIRAAAGDTDFLTGLPDSGPPASGAAVEARVYAEDPARDHLPSAGLLTCVDFPGNARVDTWIERGLDVPATYDPMLAKIITTGDTRERAWAALADALAATRIEGVHTNLGQLRAAATDDRIKAVLHDTGTVASIRDTSPRIDVLQAGVLTTVQDWPGRIGHWQVGVPPSGPMDDYSFRLGNRALGNPEGDPGLECTITGPTLRFSTAATVCVTGAPAPVTLDGAPAPQWEPISVPAGGVLAVGAIADAGARTYVLFQGGLDVPTFLGSAATFPPGRIGGYTGDQLRAGDRLLPASAAGRRAAPVPVSERPAFGHAWDLAVTPGPQPAPHYFTTSDMERIYAADWSVQVHAGRSGVRLDGPRPEWARTDGGEAGLHPSNLHDNPYSVGTVNFTGDTPALLGPDGPSLGGFACPFTVTTSDRWKLGQLRPGDTVRFVPVAEAEADRLRANPVAAPVPLIGAAGDDATLAAIAPDGDRPAVAYRRAGDDAVLLEYGPMHLDLGLRMRVGALMDALGAAAPAGLIDTTPGVRSLHLHVDPDVLPIRALTGLLVELEQDLPDINDMTVPSREVRLPISWNDAVVDEAIARYATNVRDDALFNPSNIEFIRRINGLASIEDVAGIATSAEWLVLGLGDVYLGAPAAVPVDPRHRLVTTKYNPARTWTAEGTVGIGGSYMCIYGMDSPGGYQLVGRTAPIWAGLRDLASFHDGLPWLLRFFDRVVFERVTEEELAETRRELAAGRARIDIRPGTFAYADYRRLLADNAAEIGVFQARQAAAFDAERQRWADAGEFDRDHHEAAPATGTVIDLAPGETLVEAPMAASVWRVTIAAGDAVSAGDTVVVLEAMKLEMPVTAPVTGTVTRVLARPGEQAGPGTPLLVISAP
ncbi:urea carboxylase [Glycomyces algeriensis]|uniref:Urea carboxylase n=1 Tax=Glycomyces algeriensis TaxID=256037 RepID=A0A9W6GB74_9ACTN|nr:urea carboxylase [Glycomyces algeriensis]MDA1367416.1 urea carboxylase [Glycomyces algeriensis]MDR7350930.1 urea carboxylase [Glycomyces algeriensis]GLI43642.1 urea carboxylase [Glycomyces algeriensis]